MIVCNKCGNPLVCGENWIESLCIKNDRRCNTCRNNHTRVKRKEMRDKIIHHYTNGANCCAICGAKSYLEVDHTNGGGNKHRKEVGKGDAMLYWIINNDYPPMFRILCAACNNLARYTDDQGILQHYASMSIMTKESLDS